MMNFKTKDLALATVLRIRGIKHICMELNGDQEGIWVFEASEDISKTATDYNEGAIMIEPRRYNRELSKVRGELFAFLRTQGITPKKRTNRHV